MKTKKCPNCGTEMAYNEHYHCFSCDCGKTYNYSLQELKPVSDWQYEYDNEEY